ncbi:hypothetical protein CF54_30990 [Streptomyces sp. Tu 6176]|uniref:hypothetical protein n=1 Tax=Streptomyces sp. Tu 6176 TaxID=1470557 RepID=UPI00044B2B12|nr:hypothetical protein [Streptomyces sp. Tu 6176]EYT79508.1 hypothetical protein CF54_30990 [Streptomyces sp. Tu 6176]
MAYGAHHSPTPPPRPDLGPARDCEHCLGWGTVVTHDGRHELCGTCQSVPDGGPPCGATAPRHAPD